jgi:hypothetical protein
LQDPILPEFLKAQSNLSTKEQEKGQIMRINMVGDKPDHLMVNFKNVDTVPIPAGSPLILKLNTGVEPRPTYDGLQVVLPSTAGAGATYLTFFGVATPASGNPTQVNQTDYCQVFGLCWFALVTKSVRGNSSVSWPSSASMAQLQAMKADTVNNVFIADTGAPPVPQVFLADNVAAFTGGASSAGDTRLVLTQGVRMWIRNM